MPHTGHVSLGMRVSLLAEEEEGDTAAAAPATEDEDEGAAEDIFGGETPPDP